MIEPARVFRMPVRQEPLYHPDQYLTREQLAEWLQMSVTTVDRLVKSEGLPSESFGRRLVRFRVADVAGWLESRRGAA